MATAPSGSPGITSVLTSPLSQPSRRLASQPHLPSVSPCLPSQPHCPQSTLAPLPSVFGAMSILALTSVSPLSQPSLPLTAVSPRVSRRAHVPPLSVLAPLRVTSPPHCPHSPHPPLTSPASPQFLTQAALVPFSLLFPRKVAGIGVSLSTQGCQGEGGLVPCLWLVHKSLAASQTSRSRL